MIRDRKEYNRVYQWKNKQKIALQKQAYYQIHRQEFLTKSKSHYLLNREQKILYATSPERKERRVKNDRKYYRYN